MRWKQLKRNRAAAQREVLKLTWALLGFALLAFSGELLHGSQVLWDGKTWSPWSQATEDGEIERFLSEKAGTVRVAEEQQAIWLELIRYFARPWEGRVALENRAYQLELFAEKSDQPIEDFALVGAVRNYAVQRALSDQYNKENKFLAEQLEMEDGKNTIKYVTAGSGYSDIKPAPIPEILRDLQGTEPQPTKRAKDLAATIANNQRRVSELGTLFQREMLTFVVKAFSEKRLEHVLLAIEILKHCQATRSLLDNPIPHSWGELERASIGEVEKELEKIRKRIGNKALGTTPLYQRMMSKGPEWASRLASVNISLREVEEISLKELESLKKNEKEILSMINSLRMVDALRELKSLYAASYGLIRTRAFPVSSRNQVAQFLRSSKELEIAQKQGDPKKIRKIIEKLQEQAVDFEAKKYLYDLTEKENEISDVLREAEAAMRSWKRDQFQEKIAKAESLAPRNLEVSRRLDELKADMQKQEKKLQDLEGLLQARDLRKIYEWQNEKMNLPDPAQQSRLKQALEDYQKEKAALELVKRLAEEKKLPALAWDEAEKNLKKNACQKELFKYQRNLETEIVPYVRAIRTAEGFFNAGDLGAAFHWFLVAQREWGGSELALEGLERVATSLARP